MTAIFERSWTTRDGERKRAYRVTFTVAGRKKFRQFKMRRQAQAFVEALSVERPKLVSDATSSPTIRGLGEAWVQACARGRDGRPPLEEETVKNYRAYFKNHLEPRFGSIQVHRITKAHFRDLRDELNAKNLSRSTVKQVLNSFKAIVQHAIDLDHLEAHPGRDVAVRGVARHTKRIEVPTQNEVRLILKLANEFALSPDKRISNAWKTYHVFVTLLIGTGVRLSEARGLRVRDVGDDRITIRQRADRRGEIGVPKSASGTRTVFISNELAEALRQRCVGKKSHDLVFSTRGGRPLDSMNLMKRMWRPLCEAASTPCYRIHSLRHYYASRLIAAGVNVKEIARTLGHADEGFTLRTYGHLFHDEDSVLKRKAAAEAVLL